MELDLRMVRYAVVLADHLNFGRAAARLMIAEQTLSAQIKQLELRLGVELFLRDRRRVALTEAGEVFVAGGRRLLADAEDLLAQLGTERARLRVDIVIEGLAPSRFAQHLLAALPDSAVEITQHRGLNVALPMVASGELDLAFGWVGGVRPTPPKSIRHELVQLEPVTVALPPDHPLARLDEVPVGELAAYEVLRCFTPEAGEWMGWQDELMSVFGLRAGRSLRGHGRASAVAAVLAYGQPALGPADPRASEPAVVRPLVDPVPLYPWSVVWRSDRRSPAVAQARREMRRLSAERGWLVVPSRRWWVPESERAAVTAAA